MENELTARISELLACGNEVKVTLQQVKERFDEEDAAVPPENSVLVDTTGVTTLIAPYHLAQ